MCLLRTLWYEYAYDRPFVLKSTGTAITIWQFLDLTVLHRPILKCRTEISDSVARASDFHRIEDLTLFSLLKLLRIQCEACWLSAIFHTTKMRYAWKTSKLEGWHRDSVNIICILTILIAASNKSSRGLRGRYMRQSLSDILHAIQAVHTCASWRILTSSFRTEIVDVNGPKEKAVSSVEPADDGLTVEPTDNWSTRDAAKAERETPKSRAIISRRGVISHATKHTCSLWRLLSAMRRPVISSFAASPTTGQSTALTTSDTASIMDVFSVLLGALWKQFLEHRVESNRRPQRCVLRDVAQLDSRGERARHLGQESLAMCDSRGCHVANRIRLSLDSEHEMDSEVTSYHRRWPCAVRGDAPQDEDAPDEAGRVGTLPIVLQRCVCLRSTSGLRPVKASAWTDLVCSLSPEYFAHVASNHVPSSIMRTWFLKCSTRAVVENSFTIFASDPHHFGGNCVVLLVLAIYRSRLKLGYSMTASCVCNNFIRCTKTITWTSTRSYSLSLSFLNMCVLFHSMSTNDHVDIYAQFLFLTWIWGPQSRRHVRSAWPDNRKKEPASPT